SMRPLMRGDCGSLAPGSSAPPQREQQAFDALLVSAFQRGPDEEGPAPSEAPEVAPELVLSEEDERVLEALGPDFAGQVFAEAVGAPACGGPRWGATPARPGADAAATN